MVSLRLMSIFSLVLKAPVSVPTISISSNSCSSLVSVHQSPGETLHLLTYNCIVLYYFIPNIYNCWNSFMMLLLSLTCLHYFFLFYTYSFSISLSAGASVLWHQRGPQMITASIHQHNTNNHFIEIIKWEK